MLGKDHTSHSYIKYNLTQHPLSSARSNLNARTRDHGDTFVFYVSDGMWSRIKITQMSRARLPIDSRLTTICDGYYSRGIIVSRSRL